MIDKKFWKKIADNWRKDSDGIDIPDVETGGVEQIDPSIVSLDSEMDDEIEDILADLDLDID